MKTTSIMTALAAALVLLAATDGAFARASTGTRPMGTNTSKPFGTNGGAGKGIGGEANTGVGGSYGGVARPLRTEWDRHPRK